jgi:hypothetical protein
MDDEAAELMGQLMTASLAQTQDVTNRVIDSLTADLADAHATLDAIRWRIGALLDWAVHAQPGCADRRAVAERGGARVLPPGSGGAVTTGAGPGRANRPGPHPP